MQNFVVLVPLLSSKCDFQTRVSVFLVLLLLQFWDHYLFAFCLSSKNTDGWEGSVILYCLMQSLPIFAFLSISTLSFLQILFLPSLYENQSWAALSIRSGVQEICLCSSVFSFICFMQSLSPWKFHTYPHIFHWLLIFNRAIPLRKVKCWVWWLLSVDKTAKEICFWRLYLK